MPVFSGLESTFTPLPAEDTSPFEDAPPLEEATETIRIEDGPAEPLDDFEDLDAPAAPAAPVAAAAAPPPEILPMDFEELPPL